MRVRVRVWHFKEKKRLVHILFFLLFSVEPIALDFQNKALLPKESGMASPQISLTRALSTNNKKAEPVAAVSNNANILENKFSGAAVKSSTQTHTISPADVFKPTQSSQKSDLNLPFRSNLKAKLKRRQPEKFLDPLSDFITLRSLQAPPAETPPNSANTEGMLR